METVAKRTWLLVLLKLSVEDLIWVSGYLSSTGSHSTAKEVLDFLGGVALSSGTVTMIVFILVTLLHFPVC